MFYFFKGEWYSRMSNSHGSRENLINFNIFDVSVLIHFKFSFNI